MNDSVDLTNLRSMTDGDQDLEKALFEEFYSSTEASIGVMAAHCVDGTDEAWRSTAHALKGTSYNLGATALGNLCKVAQDNPAAPAAEKTALVESIRAEYTKVKAYLESASA